MDDFSLEKLTVKPAKLAPKFSKNVFEYTSTVSSAVEKVTIDCMTTDSGASYSLRKSGGEKTIQLEEGKTTEIDIECTSEDGTIGHYNIKVKRLSAKDATLQTLSVNPGKLSIEFDSQVDEYYVNLPCGQATIKVVATAPDPKCQLTVNERPPGEDDKLNVGDTNLQVAVSSIDGSNTKVYKVFVTRASIPRYIAISEQTLRMKLEDPVSLAPFYRPISIRGSDPRHTYSSDIIKELVKKSKYDPLSGEPLGNDWNISDYKLDKELSSAIGRIPRIDGTLSDEAQLSELAVKLAENNLTPTTPEISDCWKSDTVNHTYEQRGWEKNLYKIFDETNAGTLIKHSQEHINKYLKSVPRTPGSTKSFPEGEGPMDHLQNAAYCLACAVKSKKTDANAHLQLGLVLEEKYIAEDMYELKKQTSGAGELASLNQQVKAGSKEEEIQAICKLHGVDAGAPLSHVLKALDTEYQAMKNSGNTAKADQVQSLFAWKNKQATQEGAAAQKASDESNPLGQAYLKYLDALSCDETKSVYHFHVGRLQVIQGLYDEAVIRLQSALSWNKQHQMSRFYLGLALTLRKEGPGDRAKEAALYIQEAVELILTKLSDQALGKTDSKEENAKLLMDNLLRVTNVHLLRSIISLGKVMQNTPDLLAGKCMSAEYLYHTALLLASQALPTVSRGDLFQQLEWVLLEGHDLLLDILLKKKAAPALISQRCERLSALIRGSTIPHNQSTSSLQLKVCQSLVKTEPCSSQALYLLGSAQLSHYDLDPSAQGAADLLAECRNSLRVSIELEGKSSHGEIPSKIKEQAWWKAANEKPPEAKPVDSKTSVSSIGAARGKPAARGGVARGTAASKTPSRGAAVAKPGTNQAARGKPAPATRGAARGGAAATRGGAKPAATAPAATTEKPTAESSKSEEPTPAQASPAVPARINKKTHQTRLTLARALSRTDEEISEAQTLYNEVMVMAPEVHDAYIELAELLRKTDPLAAVEVFIKFPVAEEPTFDDAFIFGEIVMILFKFEKYDHPKLAENMIRLGQIMGLAYLEKYVKTLEDKFKNDLLKQVYAGVNRKSVDDPDMQQFFKFKCWI